VPYPILDPFDFGFMEPGDGHQVYWEVCGNPAGRPAVVLHGGPGSGATPWWRQFFDPDRYRIVLMNQRGCGRSVPNASEDREALTHNTTGHLISDLEQLRRQLDIDRWLIFGASWGSTLGLAYAVQHPRSVSALVLWAVVTTRARDVHWLTHTMGDLYPQEFDELLGVLPESDRGGNIPAALHRMLMSEDPTECDRAAAAWCAWEDRIGTLSGPVQPNPRSLDPRRRLGFARLVTHYFGNYAFLPDDAITGKLDRLAGIPTYLLRGRLDIASPLRSAFEVAQGIPGAQLDIVETDAHGGGDDTVERLIRVLDEHASLWP
jgi:proline iminopeptidase